MERRQLEELDERILPSRPLLSYEEELKALDEEREENKFLILAGKYDFQEKGSRMQWLLRKLAGPIIVPTAAEVAASKPQEPVKTGFEDACKLNNTGEVQ